MGHAIEVAGLSKTFGATTAVQDLSFTVDMGRIVGFLGPNGAGKTTTLRMALGLVLLITVLASAFAPFEDEDQPFLGLIEVADP